MSPLLAYWRVEEGRQLLVILNLRPAPHLCELGAAMQGKILLSTSLQREGEPVGERLKLDADEGVIIAWGAEETAEQVTSLPSAPSAKRLPPFGRTGPRRSEST